MDRKERWRFRILAGLQVLAAAAAAGVSVWLLYRYAQYGERPVREAGSRQYELALPETVRVQILGDEFKADYHEKVTLTCEDAFTVLIGAEPEQAVFDPDDQSISLKEQQVEAGGSWSVTADALSEGQAVCALQKDGTPITVAGLERADGPPRYAGKLFLYRDAEGILLVNEAPLETYLSGVVASEMPSDYPLEAQKAQAVCARTYACNRIRLAQRDHAAVDLDDSVSDQVYNNYPGNESSDQAVRETRGEVLPVDGLQYYSTSCQTEHRKDLDSDDAFQEFLAQEPDAGAEYGSPWLRWEVELPLRQIPDAVPESCEWETLDEPDGIRVVKREGNGQVVALEVCSKGKSVRIEGEYRIRELLSPEDTAIRLMDGQEISGMRLLPSAFFWIESGDGRADGLAAEMPDGVNPDAAAEILNAKPRGAENAKPGTSDAEESEMTDSEAVSPDPGTVTLHGGGYGHGNGMSQNGAAALAQKGLDYREILEYYYRCGVLPAVGET